jgi:glycosyltransferase involved in cell wall biosynthesis
MNNITVHCIVKNEDRWIYFALQSVLSSVEKILIFDTGSTDQTVEIIKSIKSKKIIFEEKGEVDKYGMTKLRQEQLDKTQTDWFLILDGDEVWPQQNLKETIELAKSAPSNVVAIISSVRNCVGDVYHYLPKEAGRYEIAGHKGNLNIRLVRKTKDMRVVGEYPLEYYGDQNGSVQSQNQNLKFSSSWYLHTSFLKRSSTNLKKTSGSFGRKRLWQKGILLKKNELPEVLRTDLPTNISKILKKRSLGYEILATVSNPLWKLKQKIR